MSRKFRDPLFFAKAATGSRKTVSAKAATGRGKPSEVNQLQELGFPPISNSVSFFHGRGRFMDFDDYREFTFIVL